MPNNWLLGNVVGVAVDSHDNVWITHRPNSQNGRRQDAARHRVRSGGQCRSELGWSRRGIRVGDTGARPLCRLQGQRLGRVRRRIAVRPQDEGHDRQRAHPEVHAGRKVSAAARQVRHRALKAATAPPCSASRRTSRWIRDRRGVHHRRLHQSPGHRVRRQHRRLQAALGCVRQAPDDAPMPPFSRTRRAAQAVRHAALRGARQRRTALRLRPRQPAHSGVPERRDIREGCAHQRETGRRPDGRNAVGHRVFDRCATDA